VTEIFNEINNWKELFPYCKIDILYGSYKGQKENKRTRKLLRGLTVLSMWYDIICNLVSETKRMVNDLQEFIAFSSRVYKICLLLKRGRCTFLLSEQSSCIGILCSSKDMTPFGLEVESIRENVENYNKK
jgi:hypothetical protein